MSAVIFGGFDEEFRFVMLGPSLIYPLARPLEHFELRRVLPYLMVFESWEWSNESGKLTCYLSTAEAQQTASHSHARKGRHQLHAEQQLAETLQVTPMGGKLTGEPVSPIYEGMAEVLSVINWSGETLAEEFTNAFEQCRATVSGARNLKPTSFRGAATEFYFRNAADSGDLKAQTSSLSQYWKVDLTLLPASSKRPRRRLLVFDMDSTLIGCEVIDELADAAGVGPQVAEITARAMRGELDFKSSFRERMKTLRGLGEHELHALADRLPLMAGAELLFEALNCAGHYTMILSGGFDFFAKRLQTRLGITEVHANALDLVDGRLTGTVRGRIVDAEQKRDLLLATADREGFAMADTVAVGDGANDLLMIGAAGTGVAFHAKPLVVEQSPASVTFAGLNALLAVLGE
ncbi:MAG: phosphoserine phosphatase SerB [Pseudomonadota bacterium]